jgi:TolA-binding protein
MSQQQTLNFVPPSQSRSSSTHPPTTNEPGSSTNTKRTRNDKPEREQPTVTPPAFENVIKQVNGAQISNFELMDANIKRYFADAIAQITAQIQQQHDQQILSLSSEIASLKTSVNRLEREHQPTNTQQQNTNKNTTPATNTTQNTQQERGRSRGRTPNPSQQPSKCQNSQRRKRGASDNRCLTFSDIAALPPSTNTQTRPPPKKTAAKLITTDYPKAEREIIVSFNEPMQVPDNEAIQNVANLARIAANKPISTSSSSPPRPLLTARITSNRNIVFTTNPDLPGSDYTAYLPLIANSLKDFGEATATLNERWTKFLIHNVPTSLTPNDIRNEIETH